MNAIRRKNVTERKETEMPKKPVVKFFRTDAPKPNHNNLGLVTLRSPVTMTFPPNKVVKMKMGLSCSHALLFVPGPVSPSFVSIVHPAGKEIDIDVINVQPDTLVLNAGDPAFYAYVLGLVDFDLE